MFIGYVQWPVPCTLSLSILMTSLRIDMLITPILQMRRLISLYLHPTVSDSVLWVLMAFSTPRIPWERKWLKFPG